MVFSPCEQELFRRAALANRDNRPDLAEAAYREWLALSPDNPYPAYGLSTLLLARGAYEEGWRLYEARAYIPETGVVKPGYRPKPLPLPPEAAAWAAQTIAAEDVARLLHDDDDDAARAASTRRTGATA